MAALLAHRDDVGYSVSCTTRAPRAGEQDGVDYSFVTRAEFDARVAAGAFAAERVGQGAETFQIMDRTELVHMGQDRPHAQ